MSVPFLILWAIFDVPSVSTNDPKEFLLKMMIRWHANFPQFPVTDGGGGGGGGVGGGGLSLGSGGLCWARLRNGWQSHTVLERNLLLVICGLIAMMALVFPALISAYFNLKFKQDHHLLHISHTTGTGGTDSSSGTVSRFRSQNQFDTASSIDLWL